jgi:hypothetical protein
VICLIIPLILFSLVALVLMEIKERSVTRRWVLLLIGVLVVSMPAFTPPRTLLSETMISGWCSQRVLDSSVSPDGAYLAEIELQGYGGAAGSTDKYVRVRPNRPEPLGLTHSGTCGWHTTPLM